MTCETGAEVNRASTWDSSLLRAALACSRAARCTVALTTPATTAKTTSSTMESRRLTENVWNGGTRYQFASSSEATTATAPGPIPPTAAVSTTTSRYSRRTAPSESSSATADRTAVSRGSPTTAMARPVQRRLADSRVPDRGIVRSSSVPVVGGPAVVMGSASHRRPSRWVGDDGRGAARDDLRDDLRGARWGTRRIRPV